MADLVNNVYFTARNGANSSPDGGTTKFGIQVGRGFA